MDTQQLILNKVVIGEILDKIIITLNSVGASNDELQYEAELIKSLNSLGKSYKTNIQVTLNNGEKHFINFVIEESVIIKLTTKRDAAEIENFMQEFLNISKTIYGFLVNINAEDILNGIKCYHKLGL